MPQGFLFGGYDELLDSIRLPSPNLHPRFRTTDNDRRKANRMLGKPSKTTSSKPPALKRKHN